MPSFAFSLSREFKFDYSLASEEGKEIEIEDISHQIQAALTSASGITRLRIYGAASQPQLDPEIFENESLISECVTMRQQHKIGVHE